MAGVVLLLVATLSAIIFKRIKIPYTIGLVFVGLILSAFCGKIPGLEVMQKLSLNHDIIMYVLLPALIFQASVTIDTKMLTKNLTPTMALAAPGLVLSTIITGLIMYWATPLEIGGAMLFGALISATDPVAVISLFEIVGAPKKLRILVDGESLFNDATAIVMFNIIKNILVAGAALGVGTLISGSIDFAITFLGGLAVGAVIGFIMAQIILFADDDPMVEVALSTIVAYTAFIAADKYFEVSGVMAAMGAGIVINHYGLTRFTPKVKQYLSQFWEFMAFVANSFIFLLLGFTEDIYLIGTRSVSGVIQHIAWAVLAIQVARAVVVFGICPLLGLRNKESKISWQYQLIMFWGGLRGAVPLALVFSLPEHIPHRALIIEVTLGVVLFTLFVQGTTVKKLMSWFKLDKPNFLTRFSEMHAMLTARREGLKRLGKLKKAGHFSPETIKDFEQEYEEKVKQQEAELSNISRDSSIEKNAIKNIIWSRILFLERQIFQSIYLGNFINEKIYRKLDFYVEQTLDSLSSTSQIPKHFIKQPFDMRIQSHIYRIINHYLPLRIIHARYRAKAVTDDYLMLCCLEIGSNRAIKELEELEISGNFDAYTDLLSECKDFYNKILSEAEKMLDMMEKKNPPLLRIIGRATLRQMIYGTEINVIAKLKEDGEINEKVYEDLTETIGEQILATRRKVYELAKTHNQ
jgi:CPA1 family monovalent cation:H+ antiporter